MPVDLVFVAAIVLFLALLALPILLVLTDRPRVRRVDRPHRNLFRSGEGHVRHRKRLAVVVNPTKFPDLADVTRRLGVVTGELGWEDPIVLETTAADPGFGQARQALADGVDLVAPLGGDGTVRAVASALVGTGIPIGLLPGGTGNLLARNLDLPVDDLEGALRLACTGRNRPVDVGWVTLDPERDGPPERHAFLVMAGLGFDATIMSATSERAKATMGWAAYVATGLRNLRGPRFNVTIAVDGDEGVTAKTRTVIIGNCGRITGGITLMPDAEIDDGQLDCIILSPRGLPGWVEVSARVLTQGRRGRRALMQRHTGMEFDIVIDEPEEIELDGDVIGTASHVIARIEPRGLLVRVGATVADGGAPSQQ